MGKPLRFTAAQVSDYFTFSDAELADNIFAGRDQVAGSSAGAASPPSAIITGTSTATPPRAVTTAPGT
jgi:hypothetical protein